MSRRRTEGQRRLLAEQTARWMSEHRLDDPRQALRRVLDHHAAPPDRRLWPEPEEILSALRDYQHLFRRADQPEHLEIRRRAAVEAMRFFSLFQPRLTGTVLEGTADEYSPVVLHLHHDEPEALLHFLGEHDIAYRQGERHLMLGGQRVAVPHWSFDADGIGFELWLLPTDGLRQAPTASDGAQPIRRSTLASLIALLGSTTR